MKKKKAIIVLMLAMLLVVSIAPAMAQEDETTHEENLDVMVEELEDLEGIEAPEAICERCPRRVHAEGKGNIMLKGTGKVHLKGRGLLVVSGKDVAVKKKGQGIIMNIGKWHIYIGKGEVWIKGKKLSIYASAKGELDAFGWNWQAFSPRGEWRISYPPSPLEAEAVPR